MTRADAGIPRLTPRDEQALAHLEDMRAMWEPDVALLLGQLAGRSAAVSATSVRTAIRRWAKLGAVKAEKIYAHEPRIVWLTDTGAGLAGVKSWREPGKGVMRHTAELARVRQWLEARGLAGQPVTSWISERRWRQAHKDAIRAGAHVPDGIAVTADGAEYAVEVELSSKGPSRTLDTAVRLTQQYRYVVYLVPAGSETARTVRTALDQAIRDRRIPEGSGKVEIMELPERGETR